MHDPGVSADAPSQLSVLTIGHSRHPIEKLIGLLHEHHVEVLVDARSQPFSRFSPQFSRKPLERSLTEASIRYLFLGDQLGGRPLSRACYDADGKIDYDRVEAQDFYQRGIERLLDGIARFRVCILCAEEDPARCHRKLLIGRTLLQRGVEVIHIRASGELEPDRPAARPSSPQLELLIDDPAKEA